jgi:hypothetical protein
MRTQKLTGKERICGNNIKITGDEDSILHFWQWAFSDIRANNVRGVFAEWLVAHILEIPQEVRDSWAEYDLITPEGVTIEVKASAYLQSWQQKRPSRIIFSGLKGKKIQHRDK